jgi:polysaccharide export outer membrane protein
MKANLIFYAVLAMFTSLSLQAIAQTPRNSSAAQPGPAASPEVADTSASEYIIGPEDVLGVSVWREPELAAKVAVRPDGKVDLPLVNDIQASGLTTRQLREAITERIKRFVPDPTVSVVVLEIHSRTVSIVGSVPKPGVYPLGGPMTVMELIARAGGFHEFAKTKNVQIVRQNGTRAYRYAFNYKDYTDGRDYRQNIALQNGDVVVVP